MLQIHFVFNINETREQGSGKFILDPGRFSGTKKQQNNFVDASQTFQMSNVSECLNVRMKLWFFPVVRKTDVQMQSLTGPLLCTADVVFGKKSSLILPIQATGR